MTYRDFIVKGRINTETVDDATDILKIILGDYAVIVDTVEVDDDKLFIEPLMRK